jgi:hypothetical protein
VDAADARAFRHRRLVRRHLVQDDLRSALPYTALSLLRYQAFGASADYDAPAYNLGYEQCWLKK